MWTNEYLKRKKSLDWNEPKSMCVCVWMWYSDLVARRINYQFLKCCISLMCRYLVINAPEFIQIVNSDRIWEAEFCVAYVMYNSDGINWNHCFHLANSVNETIRWIPFCWTLFTTAVGFIGTPNRIYSKNNECSRIDGSQTLRCHLPVIRLDVHSNAHTCTLTWCKWNGALTQICQML